MDVGDWLRSLGFGAYAEAFAGNGIDLGILAELTNDDLKDLGVARLADRRAMLKAIALLPTNSAKRLDPLSSTAIGERRQVAVLFADLTDFTRLSIKIGAEETHAMLNRYFELVDGIIESYGGRVDKHIGDNVMAVFGAPIAHHDDSLRAVFAAIEIHERITSLTTDSGSGLQAHIGIASGQVVASGTGSLAHHEYTVTGEAVNLAARLQDQAGPGETLISGPLYRTIADRVSCEALGEVAMKGLEEPVLRRQAARAQVERAIEPAEGEGLWEPRLCRRRDRQTWSEQASAGVTSRQAPTISVSTSWMIGSS